MSIFIKYSGCGGEGDGYVVIGGVTGGGGGGQGAFLGLRIIW